MFKTSIIKKIVMAVTGLALLGFLAGHLLGNLKIFLGPEALNSYAEHLHSMPELIWPARILLVVFLVIHIYTSAQLTLENWAARPEPYRFTDRVQATLASRTMIWTGAVVFAFVVFHLAHYTFLIVDRSYRDVIARDGVYGMVVAGFSVWWLSALYVAAMVLLGLHVSHAVTSCLQTLGLNSKKYDPLVNAIGPVAAIAFFIGYVSIPAAVLAGVVGGGAP
jgi:succinate dehydrogenase cytochrome b subunit